MPSDPSEKPTKEEIEQAKIEIKLQKAMQDAHSIYIDGKNETMNGEDTAKKILRLEKDVIQMFHDKYDDAVRESQLRKEVYRNEKTRPNSEQAKNYGVHFVLKVDTKLGWVEVDRWKRCKSGKVTNPDTGEVLYECPEHQ